MLDFHRALHLNFLFMRIYALLLSLLFLCCQLFAQESQIVCGHELVLKHWEKNYPEVRRAVDDIFSQASDQRSNAGNRSNEVYTIPVVVHIVWKDSVENLPDSLVEAQIKVLNEDYRRLNADAINVRNVFAPVVSDAKIEFDLIEVIRVQTDASFEVEITGGLPDHVKQSSGGGSDAWDTESYLNIWVCKIEPIAIGGFSLGQILGYAYPPAGLPNWPDNVSAPSPELDGVVIDYRAFGPDNPYPINVPGLDSSLQVKGRTAVHEVGHYLGLRHVWGDGGGIFGGDSCGDDDGVSDTPNTAGQANFDCDTSRNTCIDANDDLPDMIENFMDYAAESCMNSFTIGQTNIMRAVLEGERCGLVGNCLQTSTKKVVSGGEDLEVFPNPTNGLLNIQMENIDLRECTLEVHDLLGRRVISRDNTPNVLSVNHLLSGIYLLRIENEKQRWVKRIVVK
jgi:hypothetical protein